jgi:hypothetical protein
MTYLSLLIASLLLFIIPIASATLARLIHFALGLQGTYFDINSIFGKIGLYLLTESSNKIANFFKEAITCIYCFTTHLATLFTIIIYSLFFGYYGLLAILVVPPVALTLQNFLQFYIYQPYFTDETNNVEEEINNEDHNGSN